MISTAIKININKPFVKERKNITKEHKKKEYKLNKYHAFTNKRPYEFGHQKFGK